MLRDFSQTGLSISSSLGSKKGQTSGRTEAMPPTVHPLKSIHLGSDRRYNNYWLFLGPCDETDPGHRRIYFESSEDGHWQVIETKQVVYAIPFYKLSTLFMDIFCLPSLICRIELNCRLCAIYC